MKNRLVQLLSNRPLIYSLLIGVCLFNGIAQTAITYDAALGMGDNSTFYAFTRNVVNGESMYQDFIHFRTPGTITLFAIIMNILGQAQSTTEISTRIETLVLFPLLFLAASMILFRKKSPWYVVLAYGLLAFLPGVAQLRAGFGLLTVAVYLFSFDVKKYRHLWLVLTGLLLSVTFIFGQEIALMGGLCIVASELLNRFKTKELLNRMKFIILGLLAGLLPLVIYLLAYSNIGNFIYYTTYYSFILQPKYMNLPFPDFRFENILYFLPFIMYWLCFLVVYASKKLDFKTGLLLSFGILRLITATGRSDFGHLLFSIPEIFIIVPYLLVQAKSAQFSTDVLKKFAPYGLVLLLLFVVAIKGSGIALSLVPFVILFALRQRKLPSKVDPKKANNFRVYLLLGVAFIGFIYLLTPTYISVLKGIKTELVTDDSKTPRIGGVKTDEINFNQVQAVKEAVAPLHPKTIFAFPIQPFYYSLADHHASRFLTFEPQTTVHEQDQTIEDLKRTKPEVIIFDPLQAQGLSGSLWKISDYITANYEVHTEVAMREVLWVMVPKKPAARDDKLTFQLFKEVTNKNKAAAIQNSAEGQQEAIDQKPGEINFDIVGGAKEFEVAIQDLLGHGDCGQVSIRYNSGRELSTDVCDMQGKVIIPLSASEKSIHITLRNSGSLPILWNDPSIQ
jgi:hypothetical protein